MLVQNIVNVIVNSNPLWKSDNAMFNVIIYVVFFTEIASGSNALKLSTKIIIKLTNVMNPRTELVPVEYCKIRFYLYGWMKSEVYCICRENRNGTRLRLTELSEATSSSAFRDLKLTDVPNLLEKVFPKIKVSNYKVFESIP